MLAAAALAVAVAAGCGERDPGERPAGPGPAAAASPETQIEPGAPAAPAPPVDLDPAAGPAAAELEPGGERRYRLHLDAGDFVRLAVEQLGVDLAAVLAGPDGEVLIESNRPSEGHGAELVAAVAERSGAHELVLSAPAEGSAGGFRVTVAALRPATAADRRLAAAYRRFTETRGLAPDAASERWHEAAATWRELGEPALEGEARRRLAYAHQQRREWPAAIEHYEAAVAAFERAGERWWEAGTRFQLGSCRMNQGETDRALEEYRVALELARRAGDPFVEGLANYGLGVRHLRRGELQPALDRLERALALWGRHHRGFDAEVLHELGVLHARYLGDPERGRELLAAALAALPESAGLRRSRTLEQLGRLAYEAGDLGRASRLLEESLAVPRPGDLCGRAVTAARLAVVEDARGAPAAADARIDEALAGLGRAECGSLAVVVHLQAAELAERRGEHRAARERYRTTEALYREQSDRNGRAWSLAGIARAERALGDRAAALAAVGEALAIWEGVRPTVLREDLRTSFFAGAQDAFDLEIELLVELGRDAEAWAAAERARAQALRDLLAEAGADLRRGADPALIARERALQGRLNELESRRLQAGDARAESELEAAVAALEAVRGEIRRHGPAAGADAAPPAPADLYGALDPGTLLLEFRLADRRSHLWAVEGGAVETFELPPRGEVEALAAEAAAWLGSLQWPGRNPGVLCELSRMLLGPVAGRLAGRRLVLVPDGALQSLAFAALPDPAAAAAGCARAEPLVAAHEISYLPSAAALALQRRRLAGRRPAEGWLAVVADPVYEAGDERLDGAAGGRPPGRRGTATGPFRRLPYSGAEADAVLSGLPPARVLRATGTRATRAAVLDGALGGYRVVHVAAHGVLDAERPLLSYLALSRFGPGGPVAGDLYAHEVYGLDLPAELVVLSACDTALGREVRGEGLVGGLPRAFLYAGAARVLVSLWAVQDAGTAELMARFYRGLVDRRLPPAQALREAQLAQRRSDPRPHRWAGFVLQGDPRPLPPFGG